MIFRAGCPQGASDIVGHDKQTQAGFATGKPKSYWHSVEAAQECKPAEMATYMCAAVSTMLQAYIHCMCGTPSQALFLVSRIYVVLCCMYPGSMSLFWFCKECVQQAFSSNVWCVGIKALAWFSPVPRMLHLRAFMSVKTNLQLSTASEKHRWLHAHWHMPVSGQSLCHKVWPMAEI